MKHPEFIVVDLFCGAGGTTTGFEMTNGLAKVIACVNHDKNAIKSHWANHPDVVHFEEDIRTLELGGLSELVKTNRKLYPGAKLILWASLECTNFSKAKGGLPRDADSRSLADELERYIAVLEPEIVQIENVVEFMAWGALDANGKPVSKNNGTEWIRWKKELCGFGYTDEWKQLNAADFGAYTSRNRLFGMFSKEQHLITFPEPTHLKNPSKGNLFAACEKWKPVKEVLDLEDDGNSIFLRKKNLSEKTLERIYAGLIKFVANGDESFIAKYYSGRPEGKVKSLSEPCGTIKTADGHSLIKAQFLLKYNSTNAKTGKYVPPSINNPSPTISTQNRIGIVKPCFLVKFNHNETVRSIEDIAPTLTTKDRLAFCVPQWIDRNFTNGGNLQSIDQPAGALLSIPKMNLVKCEKFILNSNFNEVYETDTAAMVKIKQFMAAYAIGDIKMRMLKIPELLKIQGFPNEYKLEGTQTEQKKFIGNAVHPLVVKHWIEAIVERKKSIKAA